MTAAPGPQGLEMRGGSQVKMRFMGGLFTKDRILPRWGLLTRAPEPDEPGVERMTLRLEDRMGFGLMDPGMHSKYHRIFESIAFSIEAAIRENTGDMKDALDLDAACAEARLLDRTTGLPAVSSTAGELERLAQLHERGLLSAEQFEAAKAKILR
jgi:hypothetical protein